MTGFFVFFHLCQYLIHLLLISNKITQFTLPRQQYKKDLNCNCMVFYTVFAYIHSDAIKLSIRPRRADIRKYNTTLVCRYSQFYFEIMCLISLINSSLPIGLRMNSSLSKVLYSLLLNSL
jgi:hypothetical protein